MFFLMLSRPLRSTLFPYTTLFRSFCPNRTFAPVQGSKMHGYAAVNPAIAKSKFNKRLLIPKLLFVPAIAFALVSQHVYVENGFWDTTWDVVSFLILLVAAFGRVWCAAYMSGRNNDELVADGPY